MTTKPPRVNATIERVARGLCEFHIRAARRHDTPQETIDTIMPRAVEYAWRCYIPEAQAAMDALHHRPVKKENI
jgi:hypothetical protein